MSFIDEKNKRPDNMEHSAKIESVIRRYADMIYRIAYQHTGSPTDAEDILQEVKSYACHEKSTASG